MQPGVEALPTGWVERMGKAIADPFENGHVTRHRTEVAGRSIDSQLLGP